MVGIDVSKLGQSLGVPFNHDGPVHQRLLFLSSVIRTPLDPKSAGFSIPGQCPQSLFELTLRISSTMCCTNCFQPPGLLTQHNTVLLSVQYLAPSNSYSDYNARLTASISCAKILAAINSNLDILSSLIGATLVLLATNFTYTLSHTMVTRYTTAQYALLEASPNPCNQ